MFTLSLDIVSGIRGGDNLGFLTVIILYYVRIFPPPTFKLVNCFFFMLLSTYIFRFA